MNWGFCFGYILVYFCAVEGLFAFFCISQVAIFVTFLNTFTYKKFFKRNSSKCIRLSKVNICSCFLLW